MYGAKVGQDMRTNESGAAKRQSNGNVNAAAAAGVLFPSIVLLLATSLKTG